MLYSQRLRRALSLLALGVVLLPATAVGEEHPTESARPTFVWIEDYLEADQLDHFITAAQDRLQSEPTNVTGPRQAYDLLIAATLKQDAELADRMKTRLVFDFADSPYTRFLLTSFGNLPGQNAEPERQAALTAYRAFLVTQLKTHEADWWLGFSDQFCRAVQIGVDHWGATLLEDDEFALLCCLAARHSQRHPLARACEAQLSRSENSAREVTEAAFGYGKTDVERVLALHALKHQNARTLKQFLLARLNEQQRQQSDILRITVESLLGRRLFHEALPLIAHLLSERRDPQLLLWQAWCQVGEDRQDEAMATLRSLPEEFPADPWTQVAREFAESIDGCDKRRDEYIAALFAVGEELRRKPLTAIQCNLAVKRANSPALEIYLAVRTDAQYFEIAGFREGQHLFAYRTDKSNSWFLIGDAPAIVSIPGQGLLPVPGRLATGDRRLNWTAKLVTAEQALAMGREAITESPPLQSESALRQSLGQWLKGHVAAVIDDREDGRWYCWVNPIVNRPELNRFRYRITDRRLTRFELPPIISCDLRYGSDDEALPAAPPWPDRPVVTKGKQHATAELLRLVAAAVAAASSLSGESTVH